MNGALWLRFVCMRLGHGSAISHNRRNKVTFQHILFKFYLVLGSVFLSTVQYILWQPYRHKCSSGKSKSSSSQEHMIDQCLHVFVIFTPWSNSLTSRKTFFAHFCLMSIDVILNPCPFPLSCLWQWKWMEECVWMWMWLWSLRLPWQHASPSL